VPPSLRGTPPLARHRSSADQNNVGADAGEHPDADAASSTLVRRLSQQLADARRQHREEVGELQRALEAAHGELLVLRRGQNTESSD